MKRLHYFKRYRFEPSKFRLGMRTFKTGLSVFIILLVFSWLGLEGGMQIAALTAVFSLREDFERSVEFGLSRILANTIGGFYALLYFCLLHVFPENQLTLLVGVPIAVMLIIMSCVSIGIESGVIGGVAAFLIISLSVPYGETVLYVFSRVLETFFGVFVAIVVNYDVNRLRSFFQKKVCKKS